MKKDIVYFDIETVGHTGTGLAIVFNRDKFITAFMTSERMREKIEDDCRDLFNAVGDSYKFRRFSPTLMAVEHLDGRREKVSAIDLAALIENMLPNWSLHTSSFWEFNHDWPQIAPIVECELQTFAILAAAREDELEAEQLERQIEEACRGLSNTDAGLCEQVMRACAEDGDLPDFEWDQMSQETLKKMHGWFVAHGAFTSIGRWGRVQAGKRITGGPGMSRAEAIGFITGCVGPFGRTPDNYCHYEADNGEYHMFMDNRHVFMVRVYDDRAEGVIPSSMSSMPPALCVKLADANVYNLDALVNNYLEL